MKKIHNTGIVVKNGVGNIAIENQWLPLTTDSKQGNGTAEKTFAMVINIGKEDKKAFRLRYEPTHTDTNFMRTIALNTLLLLMNSQYELALNKWRKIACFYLHRSPYSPKIAYICMNFEGKPC